MTTANCVGFAIVNGDPRVRSDLFDCAFEVGMPCRDVEAEDAGASGEVTTFPSKKLANCAVPIVG